MNFPDVLLSYGRYQFKPEPPFIPGAEAAGVVSAVGKGVGGFAVGDRVVTTMVHGAFAETIVIPEQAAVALPGEVDFTAGAITLMTYATTYHALVDRAQLLRRGARLAIGHQDGGQVRAQLVAQPVEARQPRLEVAR